MGLRAFRTACFARWAAVRRRLPHGLQDALTHLPTSIVDSTPVLCADRGWACAPIGLGLHRSLPRVAPDLGAIGAVLAGKAGLCPPWPLFAAEIPDGRVLGGACTAVAPGGVVLADVSPHHHVPLERHRALVNSLWAPPPRVLKGSSALVGASGHRNYYHWLVDMVPRIELLRAGGHGDRVDRWIVPSTPLRAAERVLELCGVDPARIFWHGRGAHVRCERLLVTSAPAPLGGATARSVAFLRDRCLARGGAGARSAGRRLFLARNGTRRVANMDAIAPVLRRHGIEVVSCDGRSFDDQVSLFSSARLVIGVHGAGLTNAIFMPEGSSLVEVVPPWYPVACYLVMASEAGLRYRAVPGEAAGAAAGPHDDVAIDPDALDAQLKCVVPGSV